LQQVEARLRKIHDGVEEAFHAAITPYALEVWK
jgi:hypothetical protein